MRFVLFIFFTGCLSEPVMKDPGVTDLTLVNGKWWYDIPCNSEINCIEIANRTCKYWDLLDTGDSGIARIRCTGRIY